MVNKEIVFSGALENGELVAPLTDFDLDVRAQIGIRFTKMGKITLYFAPASRINMSNAIRIGRVIEEFSKPNLSLSDAFSFYLKKRWCVHI